MTKKPTTRFKFTIWIFLRFLDIIPGLKLFMPLAACSCNSRFKHNNEPTVWEDHQIILAGWLQFLHAILVPKEGPHAQLHALLLTEKPSSEPIQEWQLHRMLDLIESPQSATDRVVMGWEKTWKTWTGPALGSHLFKSGRQSTKKTDKLILVCEWWQGVPFNRT